MDEYVLFIDGLAKLFEDAKNGEWIKGEKISKKQIAEDVGISYENLVGAMKGTGGKKIGPTLQNKLASYFGMSFDDIKNYAQNKGEQLESKFQKPGNSLFEIAENANSLAAAIMRLTSEASKGEEADNIYKRLVEQCPARIKIVNAEDLTTVYKNKAYAKWESVCTEANHEIEKEIVDKVINSYRSTTQTVDCHAKTWSIMAYPICDNSHIEYVALIARDITKRYKQTTLAETTAARFKAMGDVLRRNIYVWDEEKHLEYTNATKEGRPLEGATEDKLVNLNTVSLYLLNSIEPVSWKKLVDAINSVFENRKPLTCTVKHLKGHKNNCEIYPIFENDVFRGVFMLSEVTT